MNYLKQTKEESVGVKYDQDKNMLNLVEPEFIEGVGNVLTFGAKKYAPNSWQNVEGAEERYYAATLRHLMAWRKGEVLDPESGLPHLDHVACNVMFLQHFERRQTNG